MKKIIVLLILGVCLVVGCTTTSNSTYDNSADAVDGITIIDVENPGGPKIAFKDLIDSVHYVVLDESDEKALIGKYYGNIHKGGGRIIVEEHSDYPVKFFDDNGKFINSIRRGQGPGEVEYVHASCYNVAAKEYVVYNGGSVSIFDNDGNFKSKVQVPFSFDKMTCLNGDYLLYKFSMMFSSNDDLNNVFIVTDKDFNIKYKALSFAEKRSAGRYFGPDDYYFRNLGDKVEFPNKDTIYSYDGKTLSPVMYVVYDNKMSDAPDDKYANTMEYVSNGQTQIIRVGSHNFDSGHNPDQHLIIRNVKSGHLFNHCHKPNFFEDLLFFWSIALEDGTMCMALTQNLAEYDGTEVAANFTPELKPLIKKIAEEDSHVLIFFKFKDF